jgi:hypothetical protein
MKTAPSPQDLAQKLQKARRVDELEIELKNTKKQRDLLLLYLYDTVCLRPPDTHAASPEGNYGATLYRCTTGSGGYFVLKPFGSGTPSVHYLDEIDGKWPTEIRILADRLRIQRKKICDEAEPF